MKEKENEFIGYIYGLYDPNTDELRYVGKTTKSLNRRLWFHMYDVTNGGTTHKCNWIRSLGCEPLIKELLVVMSDDRLKLDEELNTNEVRLISEFSNLTNTTLGGEGCLGYKHTEENKKHISSIHKGKNVSDETRKKIGEKSKGRFFSEESRRKIGEKSKGRVPWNKGLNNESNDKLKKLSHKLKGVFSGENNPSAKLTWGLVNEIRGKYINGLMRKEIVSVYGIPDGTIGSILQNRSWICSEYGEKLENKKPKIKEIRELYLNGYSINWIMKTHNHPKSTLTKIVYNITWVCTDYQNNLNKKRGL